MRFTRPLCWLVVAVVSLTTFSGCAGSSSSGGGDSEAVEVATEGVPALGRWESQMVSFGLQHCKALTGGQQTFDESLAATYYDAEWVFYQIGDYVGDTMWYGCAEAAERVYRDRYVVQNHGQVPGYWIFPHGLAQDYLRTDDQKSLGALRQLSQNAAFARDSTPLAETVSADLSREVAYSILAYLSAEDAGEPRRSRLQPLVDQALGHLHQWTVAESTAYVRPFMVALTAHALITYQQRTGDPRIVPALATALDWIWDNAWLPEAQSFRYTDRQVESGGTEPAPDLNLLIAPAFEWIYHQTGEQRFRQRGDQIFSGGVSGAYLGGPKQFNQSYRWSFEYVRWRAGPG